MKTYGKLVKGEVLLAPATQRRSDGTTVVGYNTCEDLMLEDGWKPIVTTPPPGVYFSPGWEDTGTEIRQTWTPYEPPPPPPYVEPQPEPMTAYGTAR